MSGGKYRIILPWLKYASGCRTPYRGPTVSKGLLHNIAPNHVHFLINLIIGSTYKQDFTASKNITYIILVMPTTAV